MSNAQPWDVVVVGAGILGLATARELLLDDPRRRVLVLEKDPAVASQQSGHNSGVIHSGIYYRPGSLKARLCREGRRLLLDYCGRRGIDHRIDGKIIVATRRVELGRLEELHRRGEENGLKGLRRIGTREIAELEPHVRGQEALHVPEAGVVDFGRVCRALAQEVGERGGEVRRGASLEAVEPTAEGLSVRAGGAALRARALVACAGLHADRVAERAGVDPGVRVVPFRGEYFRIEPADRIRALVYPVPDPELPFLGVHLTRQIDGTLHAGPNAVLALAREGYSRGDVDLSHLLDLLSHRPFWSLARRQWRHGLREMRRSFSRGVLLEEIRRLLPSLRAEELRRDGAGVRAQLVDRRGELVDDFLFAEGERALHVLNAPSPAATAALAIAREIVERARGIL